MNRTLALSCLALLAAAGTVRADDIGIDPVAFQSTATRAEVVAQLHAFRQSRVNPWADDHDPLAHFVGTRTRAEVQAEYIAERELVAALNGEDGGAMLLARREVPSARVQVAAE